jgi:hypothetical protein
MTIGEEYIGFFFDWIEDYSQLFGNNNWYNFRIMHIEPEWDRIFGGVELTFIVLGLGFRARWNYKETEDIKILKRRVKDITEGNIPG